MTESKTAPVKRNQNRAQRRMKKPRKPTKQRKTRWIPPPQLFSSNGFGVDMNYGMIAAARKKSRRTKIIRRKR